MLQLCPLDMLKKQEQTLLHSLLSNKPSEACTTNIIPHLNELHLLRINSIAVIIVIFAAINRDHRDRDTLRVIPSTKEDPPHVSTKQSLTLLCDDSRCPLTVTSGSAITTTAVGVGGLVGYPEEASGTPLRPVRAGRRVMESLNAG